MFALEHSKAGYWSDFVVYALAIAAMSGALVAAGTRGTWAGTAGLVAAGLAGWSFVEYAMHRFVLHGIEPFKRWHALHHARPTALVSAPTVLSATLIAALVFAPLLPVAGLARATAVTLGVTTGYFLYALCHHATHHWRPRGAWLRERKRWHALHHRHADGACYGVTSTLWDRLLGTASARSLSRSPAFTPIHWRAARAGSSLVEPQASGPATQGTGGAEMKLQRAMREPSQPQPADAGAADD